MDDLDALLNRSDPARGRLNDIDPLIADLANATASAPRRHWWKRPRIVLPIAFGVALLATGAAAYVPLTLFINGQRAESEVRIPIHYETETGVTVDCWYGIYVGDPANRTEADQRLADFLNAQDWTGIGQRIYEKAIAEPFAPGPNDDWEVDTQEIRDDFSFNRALSELVDGRVPESLVHDGMGWGATSNCTGQLR
ncbi:hypothetical protein [Microbacterium sp. NPDC057650]|uniref:hypothetical protein n=1 Tax=unclassified Microbacterium TaxID=2609290 RepID=UPI00366B63C8